MSRANIKDQMAPTNLFGADLQPMRQAYMGVRFRQQTEHRAHDKAALYGKGQSGSMAQYPGSGSNWQRDYEICRSIERRGMRGGMTMRPTDALSNMPRRTMADGEL